MSMQLVWAPRALGVRRFLRKPVAPGTMLRAVSGLIEEHTRVS